MKWLTESPPTWAASPGLFLIRVIVGGAFIFHGQPKIENPFHWLDGMGEAAPPGFLQATAAVIEVGGGILLILGLFTRIAALSLVAQMIAALVLVHLPQGHPFVGAKPGDPSSELAIVYLGISMLIAVFGPGAWSVDGLLTRLMERRAALHRPMYYAG
jgi:putative oxidoreductase